jgi:hypothetical protein
VRFDIAFLARRTSIGEINIPGDVFWWTGATAQGESMRYVPGRLTEDEHRG